MINAWKKPEIERWSEKMTREEAHNYRPPGKCEEDGDGYRLVMPLQDHIDTINAIYDDIEKKQKKVK